MSFSNQKFLRYDSSDEGESRLGAVLTATKEVAGNLDNRDNF